MALGPDGPVGYAADVTIEETDDPATNRPRRIVVRGRGDSLALTMDMAIEQETSTAMREGLFGAGLDFLQLRARYLVSGKPVTAPSTSPLPVARRRSGVGTGSSCQGSAFSLVYVIVVRGRGERQR